MAQVSSTRSSPSPERAQVVLAGDVPEDRGRHSPADLDPAAARQDGSPLQSLASMCGSRTLYDRHRRRARTCVAGDRGYRVLASVDKVGDRRETARLRAASGGQPGAAQAARPAAAHLGAHRAPAGDAIHLGVPSAWCDRDSTPRDHRVSNRLTPRADHHVDRSLRRTRRRAQQDPHAPPPGNRGQRRQGPQRASLTGGPRRGSCCLAAAP
jgi:hypothetical protein